MKKITSVFQLSLLSVGLWLGQGFGTAALAHEGSQEGGPLGENTTKRPPSCQLVTADRIFDGVSVQQNAAVLIKRGKVAQVGSQQELKKQCRRRLNLGDATVLPGFIESHAHLTFQNVDPDVVLRHGITTLRDVGGPMLEPMGGDGQLRLLSAGPIIQAPNGYPLNVFGGGAGGYDAVGIPVDGPEAAVTVVQNLVAGGAAVIKIALEPGGEAGAPWSSDHGHGQPPATPWPLLSLDTVKAIVAEAHRLGKRVTAHIGESQGAELALDGGVDEWAHTPCAGLDSALLQRAVDQGVKVVSTIDTMSSCTGIHGNAMALASLMKTGTAGSEFIYGSEVAHDNVPWGINAEELHLILHLTGGTAVDVLQAATSKAGKNLGQPLLGTLSPEAPADLIAVKGDATTRFKPLEYPALVMSGGRTIVNNFGH